MKVLFVHNKYRFAGGEDNVVLNEIKLLESNGIECSLFEKSSNELNPIKLLYHFLFRLNGSKKNNTEIRDKILLDKPDLVHVHNFFPLISPSIYNICEEFSIPVVQTLHNYRIIYPNSLLYNHGKVDLRTIKGSAWNVVKDKVYQNSWIKTAVMARFIQYHKKKDTWNRKVNKFIALTEFSKSIFVQFGIEPSKIVVKPNFQFHKQQEKEFLKTSKISNEEFVLFVGRISEEKGIVKLVDEWIKANSPINLKIAGTGPLEEELRNKIKFSNTNSIEYLGNQTSDQVKDLMQKAIALVFPSLWYEGFPMVIVEALSHSLPILTTNIGNQSSIIKDGVTGFHISHENFKEFIYKSELLTNDKQLVLKMRKNCNDSFIQNYTDVVNFEQVLKIYKDLIASNSIA